MKKKRWLILTVAAAVALLTTWWWWPTDHAAPNEPPDPAPAQRAAAAPQTPEAPAGPGLSQAELARQGSPLAAELNAADHAPQRDVEILRELMSQYVTALQRRGGPPIGDDADLVRVLTGRNPLRLVVIPPGHPAVSREGRLLDRWGTPYHVHALSSQSYEFRSAGPDHRLFTADDLLAR